MKRIIKLLITVTMLSATLFYSSKTHAVERIGRLGIGFNTQPINDVTAMSFKVQKSKSFAFGGYFGIDTKETGGGWAAGIKLYRNIFSEPLLTFYGSAALGLLNQKLGPSNNKSGFQIDGTFGVEFSFESLQSIGIGTEFGVSTNKIDDFNVSTVGSQFLVALFHFYL